ncbi:hypothetical protein D1872_288910 [compost metagenome]
MLVYTALLLSLILAMYAVVIRTTSYPEYDRNDGLIPFSTGTIPWPNTGLRWFSSNVWLLSSMTRRNSASVIGKIIANTRIITVMPPVII